MQNEQNGTPLSDWSIAGISWSRYSSGMMMNSDSHTTLFNRIRRARVFPGPFFLDPVQPVRKAVDSRSGIMV